MIQDKPHLGYLDSISLVLALKTENLGEEYQAIWQVFKQADEPTFYQLAPHLFVTIKEEDLVVDQLEVTPEGYKYFKELLKEDK